MNRLLSAIAALLLLVARPAGAVDPAPILVLETGVHEAAINAMAAMRDGSGFVTVSDDKTARIWRNGGQEAGEVLRPPIGRGDDGALYSVAVSAKVIGVSGRVPALQGGYGIALYSAQDYRPLGMIPGLPTAAMAMKMSPAGDRLAVGLEIGGLRVYNLSPLGIALEDTDYPSQITSLDFDPAGRLAVAAGDNSVRLYDGGLHRLPPVTLRAGARAYGIAFSADGTRLAAADRGRPAVHLVDMRSMRTERVLEGIAGRSGSFNTVAFSADGTSVFAGGRYVDNAGIIQIRRWSVTGAPAADIPVARDLVTGLLSTAGGMMFATAEPAIGMIDDTFRASIVQAPRHIDFHDRVRTKVRLSRDGSAIEIVRAAAKPLVYDAVTREILRGDGAARGFLPPSDSGFGFTVTDWKDTKNPKVNGQKLGVEPNETARSAAVSPWGAVVGTDFFVRFVGKGGVGWKVAASAPVRAVNASVENKIVIACFGDGTIHWYDAETGKELTNLFIDPETERAVQWNQEGYFDHDHRTDGRPDGRSLIGYRMNHANGRASDFIEIGQLYDTWFRPDLVGMSLRNISSPRRRPADSATQTNEVIETLRGGLPPKVTLLDACPVQSLEAQGCNGSRAIEFQRGRAGDPPSVSAPALLVRYKVEEPSNTAPGAAAGRVIPRLNDAVLRTGIHQETSEGRNRIERATIPLAHGLNVVRLSAVNANGGIEAARDASPEIRLVRSAPPRENTADRAPSEAAPAGRLFALSVGVSKLVNPAWDLANPANDATALADLLRKDDGRLFAETESKMLIDQAGSKAGIMAAMKDIATKATPDDVVIIFLAGHGRTVDGRYYFAPSDMGRGDPTLFAKVKDAKTEEAYDQAVDAVFRTEGLGQHDLLPLIQDMKATRIAFILDTCYSATVADQNSVLRQDLNATITNRIGHASGRFVLSGSFTEALDSAAGADAALVEEGHGLFTSYLLRALKGDARPDASGKIDIYQLAVFTKDNVTAASRRILERAAAKPGNKTPAVQQPAYYFAGNDFFAVRKLAAGASPR